MSEEKMTKDSEKLKGEEKEKRASYFSGQKDELAVLSALLDFFSDSALGYVSAFVACIFGLFATVSLIQSQTGFWFWSLTLVYFSLFLGGGYALLNFAYYIRIAQKTKRELISLTKYRGEFETIFEEKYIDDVRLGRKVKGNVLSRSLIFLSNHILWKPFFWIKDQYVFAFAALIYFLIGLIPWIFQFFKN